MSRTPKPSSKRVSSRDALTVVPGREVTYHNAPELTAKKPGGVKLSSTLKPPIAISSRGREAKRAGHRRRVCISVILPVSVDLLVGCNDDDPNEDSDWQILAVHSASCEATPLLVGENMQSEDFAALATIAAKAKDQQ